jgi:hypothetical protein
MIPSLLAVYETRDGHADSLRCADVCRLARGLAPRVAGRDGAAVSPAYEAPTKRMLKYCGDELDPKSRTLLDYHPVEVERQNGAGGGAPTLCSCDRAS